jgi:hypothetical protein
MGGVFRRAAGLLSGSGASHATALFRTAPAGLGTSAAVVHVFVAFALPGAILANIGAQLAELASPFATARHDDGRGTADLRAFQVERNAAGERFYLCFIQAGGRTMLAFECALIAGIDAAAHGFVAHGFWLLGMKKGRRWRRSKGHASPGESTRNQNVPPRVARGL